ncbi:unnamed protein product, partial [Phaeothamnion confervicola]
TAAAAGAAVATAAASLESLGAVEVGDAGAKGRGLFARRDVPAGAYIGPYSGELLREEELAHRYPGGGRTEYVFEVSGGLYVDASDPEKSGLTRYVNHSAEPNAEAHIDPEARRIDFYTSRAVAAGEELLIAYGETFWRASEGGDGG